MGISSALYSGVSGLNTNGQAMSVIGNNLANTNTVGFKVPVPYFLIFYQAILMDQAVFRR